MSTQIIEAHEGLSFRGEPLIDPDAPLVRIDYDDEKHRYWVDGEEVPSVTTVIGDTISTGGGLTWWAYRIGLAAAVELCRRGRLTWPTLVAGHDSFQRIVDGDPTNQFAVFATEGSRGKSKPKTRIEFEALREKLTPNHVKSDAADRGTATHEALMQLAMGAVPKIDQMPEAWRPYAAALTKWWLDTEPVFLRIEQMVGVPGRFAGRFDVLRTDADESELVLSDLKTGKDFRPDKWWRQLAAYEWAWTAMGGRKPDRLEVVLARPDGSYEVKDCTGLVRREHFEACLAFRDSIESFKDLNAKRKRRGR